MIASQSPAVESFDPSKHLMVDEPEIITMEEIGLKDQGISPVAVSKPFQLFSPEAIAQMRSEIFNVRDNHPEHVFSSNIAPCQLRGYASKYAPFTHNAWNHPDTIAAISKIAGTDLVPWGDYEIAHINFSTNGAEDSSHEQSDPNSDENQIVGWHKDSYPFVCVLMLSDSTNLRGGETAIKKPNGEIELIKSPSMGYAIVLQGRYITHQARRAFGSAERITAVTSFRPRSCFVRDDSVLDTVRPISDLSELYFHYAENGMKQLDSLIHSTLEKLHANRAAGEKTWEKSLKTVLDEIARLSAHMNKQIVPYENVQKGFLSKEDLWLDAGHGAVEQKTGLVM